VFERERERERERGERENECVYIHVYVCQAPGAACCWVAYEYMKHLVSSPIFGEFFIDPEDWQMDEAGKRTRVPH
jgi:hypothetical protein